MVWNMCESMCYVYTCLCMCLYVSAVYGYDESITN